MSKKENLEGSWESKEETWFTVLWRFQKNTVDEGGLEYSYA